MSDPSGKVDLSEFVENNPNPVLKIDHKGKVLYANGSSDPVLLHFDCANQEDVSGEWLERIQSVLKTGIASQFDIEEGFQSFRLIFVSSGQNSVNIFGRDQTREKELEKELLEGERGKAVSAVVTTYNHEIRNSLTIAMGNMLQPKNEKEEKKYNRQLRSFQRMVETLKNISNLIGEKAEFESYGSADSDSYLIHLENKDEIEKQDLNLLLVEDDILLQDIVVEKISNEFEKIIPVSSGMEAFETLLNEKVDVVVSNGNIIEEKKGEMVSKIKELKPELPIIILTGRGQEVKNRALELGVEEVLAKPINYRKLIDSIKNWVNKK